VAQAAGVKRGGTVTTIMQNVVFADVDPAYGSEPLWEADFMEAIFGQLFTAQPNGKVGMGFAAGYKYSNDNKTFTFTIKKGIKFTDGTPYNARAVAYNIKRDLSLACICAPDFAYVKTVKAIGPYTVQIGMSQPDSVLLQAFVTNTPDWIASPTAIKKMGKAAFGEHRVGAGPFEVSQIVPNSKVVLTRNPHYYVKGEPYLNGLTFEVQTVDQSAYSALESGSAQILSGISTPSIITQAKGSYDVKLLPGPLVSNLELNSFKAPFNNILAREAVSYAIDPNEILAINSPGLGQVVQGAQGDEAAGRGGLGLGDQLLGRAGPRRGVHPGHERSAAPAAGLGWGRHRRGG
jgi:ABC-type transport system substrate-binding protein